MWAYRTSCLRPLLRFGLASSEAGPSSCQFLNRANFSSTSKNRQDGPVPMMQSRDSSMDAVAQSLEMLPMSTRRQPLRSSNRQTANLHVKASRNNTIITLTTPEGQAIARVTAGMCGFKKTGRSNYEAGHQTAIRMMAIIDEKIQKVNHSSANVANLSVIFNGFGAGREAFYRALMTDAGTNTRIRVRQFVDATRIRVGGCRPKKRRML